MKQYLDLMQDILDNGSKKEDRTASGGCVVLIIIRNKRLNTMVKKPAT